MYSKFVELNRGFSAKSNFDYGFIDSLN